VIAPRAETQSKADRLQELEALIYAANLNAEQGLRNLRHEYILAAGPPLMEINANDLHLEKGYDNFQDYCKAEWGFDRQRAYQLMNAVPIVVALKGVATTEIKEGHTRVLVPVHKAKGDEGVVAVWRDAEQTADDGKITAKVLKASKEKLYSELKAATEEGDEPKTPRDALSRLSRAVESAEALEGRLAHLPRTVRLATAKDPERTVALVSQLRKHLTNIDNMAAERKTSGGSA
jgi:hypothetical protein